MSDTRPSTDPTSVSTTPDLDRLNGEIRSARLVPGWNRPGEPPLWDAPRATLEPVIWRYREARAFLDRSADLVPLELAERRNLILTNPAPGNTYGSTRTQVIAYQMILPGERARTHRHSPHAGRIILDSGPGVFTIVDGVSIPMQRGDVVLTPGWSWHGHGNDGTTPACWIDFLDVPTVQLLEPMFFEPYPDGGLQAAERESRGTPLLFPWEATCRRIDQVAPDPEQRYGRRIELGDPALPTIGIYVDRYDQGFQSRPYRTTANCQLCVLDGSGTSTIDGMTASWTAGDVIIVPAWRSQQHSSRSGAVVVTVTDEPLLRYCGYLRTSKGDEHAGDAAHA